MKQDAITKRRQNKVETNDLIRAFFICFLGISIIWLIIGNGINQGAFFEEILYPDRGDSGMDHFNSMIAISTQNPYSRFQILYPPLSCLFYAYFWNILPTEVGEIYWEEAYRSSGMDMRLQQSVMLPYILMIVAITLAIGLLLYHNKKGSITEKVLFCVVCIFSSGMLSAFERGNSVTIAMFFSLVFVVLYNSPKKILREIAFVSLAIGAGLKIYPALYGILLLREKRYKEAIRTALYGILMFFGPFLFFERFQGLRLMMEQNLSNIGDAAVVGRMNTTSAVTSFFLLFDIENMELLEKMNTNMNVLLFLGIIATFFIRETWKQLLMISILIISFAGVSCTYMLVFLFIPLLPMLDYKKIHGKIAFVYVVLICLAFAPCPYPYSGYLDQFSQQVQFSTTALVQQMSVLLMMILLFGESLQGLYYQMKVWKKSGRK